MNKKSSVAHITSAGHTHTHICTQWLHTLHCWTCFWNVFYKGFTVTTNSAHLNPITHAHVHTHKLFHIWTPYNARRSDLDTLWRCPFTHVAHNWGLSMSDVFSHTGNTLSGFMRGVVGDMTSFVYSTSRMANETADFSLMMMFLYWYQYNMYLEGSTLSTKDWKALYRQAEKSTLTALRTDQRRMVAEFWLCVHQQHENINMPTCWLWLPWTMTHTSHTWAQLLVHGLRTRKLASWDLCQMIWTFAFTSTAQLVDVCKI